MRNNLKHGYFDHEELFINILSQKIYLQILHC